MIKVLLLSGSPTDGTSWYRAAMPFKELTKTHDVSVTIANTLSWETVIEHDVVFMHRPEGKEAESAVMLCNAMGVPVWADYDDCVMSIPGRNPFYVPGTTPARINDLVNILAKVQAVTVSTPTVKEQFSALNPNTFMLPNAMPTNFYDRFNVQPRQDDRIRICWRGSDSQVINLRMLSSTIYHTIDTYPNVDWVIHTGQNPFYIRDSVPANRLTIIPWKPLPDIFISLMETSPDIGVVCLFDDTFDKGRSPTVAYELSSDRTMFVAPQWMDLPGILTYTPGDLTTYDISRYTDADLVYASGNIREKVCEAIELTADDRCARAAETREFVRTTCSLAQANEWRYKFLKKVKRCTGQKIRLAPL